MGLAFDVSSNAISSSSRLLSSGSIGSIQAGSVIRVFIAGCIADIASDISLAKSVL